MISTENTKRQSGTHYISHFALSEIAALLAATLVTAVLASIVQTQINLAALLALDAPVTLPVRAELTFEDVLRFGPVMAAIAGAALLPAMVAGKLATRALPDSLRMIGFATAGAVGMWAAFVVTGLFTPMPELVAAARGTIGLALIGATGAIGGLVYARLIHPRPRQRRPARDGATTVTLLALPIVSFLVMAPRAPGDVPRIDPASYTVQTVAAGLDRPWAIAFLPDGRRLVTEKGGRLLAFASDGRSTAISLDRLPPSFAGGENGLLDVVPDPGFARNGLLYLSMNYGEPGAIGTRLVRARLVGNRIEDVRILFSSSLKSSDSNNGGRVVVLPDDTLVLAIGDGNDTREQAQNPANHQGKLVRLDRDGQAPDDNPFGTSDGAASVIYSLGHRNPQGLAVDPADGSLLLSDHGPRGGDRLSRIRPGSNHGWPVVTGGLDYSYARVTPFRRLDRYDAPDLEWTPSIAPAGLMVYDGDLFPEWRGDLFVPALRERAVRRIVRRGGRIIGQQLLLSELGERMRDVKAAPDGSIYVLTDGRNASLLRLVPAQ